ncbi:MAG: hypothetical protein MUF49_00720 [Oculatellaceae cyanobacterium Prado106]|nr:hypothetical protein [Oculatellaceae cyanobacterium Prado106]
MHRFSIPIIDIAPFFTGSAQIKQQLAHQVAIACETIGFFMITGHGLPETVIQGVFEVSAAFFDLPLAAKMAIATPTQVTRGYVAAGGESLSYSLDQVAPPDLKEFFLMAAEAQADDPYYQAPEAGYFFAPNQFPQYPQRFQAVLGDYFHRMENLAATLMQIFALGLHLPEDFFADKINKHVSEMGSFHYPAQTTAPQPGQLRAGAHTDYGSLTILASDDAPGGLQIYTPDETWIDVRPVPSAFVINIGDLMARWTNDRWKSTLHRVANPTTDEGYPKGRQSIAFFHQPNYDALIQCLDSCWNAENPPKYTPITAGENTFVKSEKHRNATTEVKPEKMLLVT